MHLLRGIDFHSQAVRLKSEDVMTPAPRPILIGTLVVVFLGALLSTNIRPTAHAAEGDQVEYTFDRPITQGEQTYAWYRKTHGDDAAKRYGVNHDEVDDG